MLPHPIIIQTYSIRKIVEYLLHWTEVDPILWWKKTRCHRTWNTEKVPLSPLAIMAWHGVAWRGVAWRCGAAQQLENCWLWQARTRLKVWLWFVPVASAMATYIIRIWHRITTLLMTAAAAAASQNWKRKMQGGAVGRGQEEVGVCAGQRTAKLPHSSNHAAA